MKRINSTGFTVAEGLLIVIALGLISGVGYYVYTVNKETGKQQAESSIVKKEKKPADQKKDEYLVIKELGVKVKRSDLPKDTTYKNEENATDTEGKSVPNVISIYTKELTEAVAACKNQEASSGEPSLLGVYKFDGKYNAENSSAPVYTDGLFKQFDSFYLEGTSGPDGGYCVDDPGKTKQVNELDRQLRQKVKDAFSNAEEIK